MSETASQTARESREPHTPSDDRGYRKRVRAWALYDWANHAYLTVTATTFFPPYFVSIAAFAFLASGASPADRSALALARDTASNVYAFTVSCALFVAAVLAPVVGAIADITGRRKRVLIIATLVGGPFASAMFALTTGRWVLALTLYFATQVAFNVALGLNSSLLPHVARPGDLDRASSLGYAMGYVGGGVLLAICSTLYFAAEPMGIDGAQSVRLAFLVVGLWWIGFTIPIARHVVEPPATPLAHPSRGSALRDALLRLRHTLRDVRRYRELFKMLIAFWLYMEGIGAIILLATAYGAALGLATGVLTGTLLITQFVAFPYAMLFARLADPAARGRGKVVAMLLWNALTFPLLGWYANATGTLGTLDAILLLVVDQAVGALLALGLGERLCGRLAAVLDTKRAVILGLFVYTIVPIWGFFLRTQAEFVMIGWLVGSVQGGTQALSRAIYARLSPRAKSGEFFGLYGLSEKFAGILGPLLYGIVGQITHDPRASVLSVSLFFVTGIAVLAGVNVPAGEQAALAEEAAIEELGAAD